MPLCPGCGGDLAPPIRADAIYCSNACGQRVRKAARQGLSDPDAPQRFWKGYRRVRRPARPLSARSA